MAAPNSPPPPRPDGQRGGSRSDPPPPPHPHKRRRTVLACNRCRARKIKCNSSYPSCFHCMDNRVSCEYRAMDFEQGAASASTNMFEQRLKLMEDAIRGFQSAENRATIGATSSQSALPQVAVTVAVASQDLPDSYTQVSKRPDHDMTAVSTDGESEYYGPSSNVSFLRQILKTVDLPCDALQRNAFTTDQASHIRPESSPPCSLFCTEATEVIGPSSEADVYVLPELPTTTHLVSSFFRDYGLMNPFLDEATFVDTHVKSILIVKQAPRLSQLALVNMVLAIATLNEKIDTIRPAERRVGLSKRFFERARRLLLNNAFNSADLDQVQAYLLMSQHLQSTEFCSQSWITHGMAVQSALRIGLHIEPSSNTYNHIEKECRKRTWSLCVMMDRAFAKDFGRPCQIPFQTPQINLCANPFRHDVAVDIGAIFFVETGKLYSVLWNVLDSSYSQTPTEASSRRAFDLLSTAARHTHELGDWLESLPKSLRMDTLASDKGLESNTETQTLLIKVLHLRYYNVRSLVHRPLLEFAMSLSAQYSLDSVLQNAKHLTDHAKFCQPSFQDSIESATSTILIANSFEVGKLGPGMWWTLLGIVYNAALTCFAVFAIQTRHPDLHQSAGDMDLKGYIQLAMEALPKLSPGHPVVERALNFLNRMLEVCDYLSHNEQGALLQTLQPGTRQTPWNAGFPVFGTEPFSLENFGPIFDNFPGVGF